MEPPLRLYYPSFLRFIRRNLRVFPCQHCPRRSRLSSRSPSPALSNVFRSYFPTLTLFATDTFLFPQLQCGKILLPKSVSTWFTFFRMFYGPHSILPLFDPNLPSRGGLLHVFLSNVTQHKRRRQGDNVHPQAITRSPSTPFFVVVTTTRFPPSFASLISCFATTSTPSPTASAPRHSPIVNRRL